jgi:hypothetical protein
MNNKLHIAFCLVICAMVFVSHGSVLSSLAANLEPGSWVALPSASSVSLTRNWIYYSESGGWDPVHQKVYWVGAPVGDASYKLITYNVATDNWNVSGAPFSGTGHAYDANTTDPATGNHYFVMFSSTTVKKYNGSSWSNLPTLPFLPAVANAQAWFPELNNNNGGLVYVTGFGKSAYFNGSSWSVISTNASAQWGGLHVFAQYNPRFKTVLMGGGNDFQYVIYRLNSDLSYKRLNDAPFEMGVTRSLVSVDPISGRYIVFNGQENEFWEYDINLDMWMKITNMKNTPEIVISAFHVPIPDYKVILFFLLTGPNGNDRGNAYLYKHAITDSTPPTPPGNLNATPLSDKSVQLSWTPSTDAQSSIWVYKIRRDNIEIGNTDSLAFIDYGLQENTEYSYTVTAINRQFHESGPAGPSNVITQPDTFIPILLQAKALKSNMVEVVFNEPVETQTSQNSGNYNIDNNITISRAVLGNDQRSVLLSTSPLGVNTPYTLTVSNIKDQSAAQNIIATNSETAFTWTGDLIIDNLVVSTGRAYTWDIMALGKNNYIDRSYTFNTVPPQYLGLAFLKTANSDKGVRNNPLISFNVSHPVIVYVAYPTQNAPTWLADWHNTGDQIVATNVTLFVFSKAFAPGQVNLGDNDGNKNMYSVLVAKSEYMNSQKTQPNAGPDGQLFLQIEPNPFQAFPKIRLTMGSVPGNGQNHKVSLQLYDINGKLSRKYSASMARLKHGITWHTPSIACGVYLLKAQAGPHHCFKKVLIVK